MSLPLRVIGDRVLVKPDVDPNAPQQTDAGIFLAKSMAAAVTGEDASTSLSRGTVLAVGNPRHPLHDVADSMAERVEREALKAGFLSSCGADLQDTVVDAAHLLRDLVRRQPCVCVGDDVLFSADSGQLIQIDDESYVILREAELLAVVTPEQEAA